MKKICLLTALLSMALISCSKNISKNVKASPEVAFLTDSKASGVKMNSKMAVNSFAADGVYSDAAYDDAEYGLAYEEADEMESPASANGLNENSADQMERKLIKNGYIQLEVSSLQEAESSIKNWCSSFGGYIESNNQNERNGSMSVRIPSSNFEAAMDSAGNLGSVKSKNVSSQDVSESFYDLQTRLETKKIMRERLQKYLESAKDIKDMLQIEKELNSVISDIESMEGRMKRLTGQIDYSQIYVNYELPFRSDENHGFVMPDFGDGFRRFVSTVLDFFIGFFKIICYIIIFGIPLIAALGFFYWLLFGKLGLLKRLFKRLRGK